MAAQRGGLPCHASVRLLVLAHQPAAEGGALHCTWQAAEENSLECVELLLARGADVEAVDREGNNVLHAVARQKEKVRAVELSGSWAAAGSCVAAYICCGTVCLRCAQAHCAVRRDAPEWHLHCASALHLSCQSTLLKATQVGVLYAAVVARLYEAAPQVCALASSLARWLGPSTFSHPRWPASLVGSACCLATGLLFTGMGAVASAQARNPCTCHPA